jgi:hypothetical protein
MPIPAPLIAAGASLAFKGLGSIFGGRAKKKQERANKQAATNAANIQQKRSEDQRRARLSLGASMANGIDRPGMKIDPALLEQLMQERTYDFGSAIPESAGGSDAFLSGLFGGASDLVPSAYGAGVFGAVPPDATGGIAGQGGGPQTITLDDLMELMGQGRRQRPPAGPTPPRASGPVAF